MSDALTKSDRDECRREPMIWHLYPFQAIEATVRAVEAERDVLKRFVVEAMHLAQYGERAPGGDETWGEWFARAENYLRRNEAPR